MFLKALFDTGRIGSFELRPHGQPQPSLIVGINLAHSLGQAKSGVAPPLRQQRFDGAVQLVPLACPAPRPFQNQPFVKFRSDVIEVSEWIEVLLVQTRLELDFDY